MTSKAIPGITIGSRWRENDRRFVRIVEVVGCKDGKALITCVHFSMAGRTHNLLDINRKARITKAKVEAFGRRYLPATGLEFSDGGFHALEGLK